MASLAAHLTASIFLVPIGLRRLLSSSTLYHKNPSLFRSRSWFFSSDSRYSNLDLYLLLASLPIASFAEFFIFTSLSHRPSHDFSFLHQSISISIFWALLALVLVRETLLDPFLISDGLVFVLAALAFLAEYGVAGKGVVGVGVGAAVYGYLGRLAILCSGSCLYLAVRPSAFFAEFGLCCGLVLKGTWVLQSGLSLFTDGFGLRGCGRLALSPDRDGAEVKCTLVEDDLRGVAVIGFVFVLHVVVVLVVSLGVFGLSKRNVRGGEARGSLPLQTQIDLEANDRFQAYILAAPTACVE